MAPFISSPSVSTKYSGCKMNLPYLWCHKNALIEKFNSKVTNKLHLSRSFQSVAHFFKCTALFQVWRTFPYVPHFSKCPLVHYSLLFSSEIIVKQLFASSLVNIVHRPEFYCFLRNLLAVPNYSERGIIMV